MSLKSTDHNGPSRTKETTIAFGCLCSDMSFKTIIQWALFVYVLLMCLHVHVILHNIICYVELWHTLIIMNTTILKTVKSDRIVL